MADRGLARAEYYSPFAYYFCLHVPPNWKIASEFARKIMEQILTVQYTA